MRLKGDGEKKVSFGGARVFEEFWGRSLKKNGRRLALRPFFTAKLGHKGRGIGAQAAPPATQNILAYGPVRSAFPFKLRSHRPGDNPQSRPRDSMQNNCRA